MAINMDSSARTTKRPGKFSRSLAKFVGKFVAGAAIGFGLILLGSQFDGVVKWIFIVPGVAVLIGIALYTNAVSAEVRRKLGPLPLGKPDEDLKSMPLYQGRAEPSANR